MELLLAGCVKRSPRNGKELVKEIKRANKGQQRENYAMALNYKNKAFALCPTTM